MAMKGTNLVISVGTTDTGPFTRVDDLNDATMSMGADNMDISEFGIEWVQRIQGIKDCTFSLGGWYNPADTSGQVAIRNAYMNDTDLFVRFLPDGTAGFQQQVRVSSFEVSAAADGVIEVSIDLEGTDIVTMVV